MPKIIHLFIYLVFYLVLKNFSLIRRWKRTTIHRLPLNHVLPRALRRIKVGVVVGVLLCFEIGTLLVYERTSMRLAGIFYQRTGRETDLCVKSCWINCLTQIACVLINSALSVKWVRYVYARLYIVLQVSTSTQPLKLFASSLTR